MPPTATPTNISLVRTQDEIILLLGREVNRLSDFEIESKYKDAVIMNLRCELADLSQRLSETAAAAAAQQSNRCTLKFQGLDEGDDPRQKEIESMKSQVGPGAHQSPESPPSEWSPGYRWEELEEEHLGHHGGKEQKVSRGPAS